MNITELLNSWNHPYTLVSTWIFAICNKLLEYCRHSLSLCFLITWWPGTFLVFQYLKTFKLILDGLLDDNQYIQDFFPGKVHYAAVPWTPWPSIVLSIKDTMENVLLANASDMKELTAISCKVGPRALVAEYLPPTGQNSEEVKLPLNILVTKRVMGTTTIWILEGRSQQWGGQSRSCF